MATIISRARIVCAVIALSTAMPLLSHAADAKRQADVSRRGKDVMPFSLEATTHIFTKTAAGGTQRVVAKNVSDAEQTELTRGHLQDIERQFLKGDFSGPAHIHGPDMPGLSELRSAKPGRITITYRNVPGGAELEYRTADAGLVAALHNWFDAQLSDHGADAVEGHPHRHGGGPKR